MEILYRLFEELFYIWKFLLIDRKEYKCSDKYRVNKSF